MAAITNKLYAYYVEKLPTEENFVFDFAGVNLKGFMDDLATKSYTLKDFQLPKIQAEDIFVLPVDERFATYIQDLDNFYDYNFNYIIIENVINDEETQYIPYIVQKTIWNGMSAVKFYVKLHVAQFLDTASLEVGSIIERSHIDRFEGTTTIGGNDYLIPRIDYHPEPIDTPVKYLSSNESVSTIIQESTTWNLVYYSDPNATNAIRTLIIPNVYIQGVNVRVNNSSHISIQGDTYYIIRGVDNQGTTITYDNNTFTFGTSGYTYEEIHAFNDGGTILVKVYGWNLSPDGNNWNDYDGHTIASYSANDTNIYYDNDIVYYTNPSLEKEQLNLTSNHFIIPFTPKNQQIAYLNTTTTSVALNGLNSIPLTNPRLIKIVGCPFCPANLASTSCIYRNISDSYMSINCVEWISNGDLPLTSLFTTSSGFIDLIAAPNSFDLQAKNIKYETKLLNSTFTENNIEYGAYKLNIPLELYTFNASYPRFSYELFYKQAKLKSDLLFKYSPDNALKSEFSGLLNVESNYLVSDIDNEKPIFTSDYLNYIKNGYNYDKANMNRQTAVSSALAATSIIGGVAGIAAGAFTGGISAAAGIGLITSGVSSAINIVNSRISSENNIKQKLASYTNSSTGISGVNALDLRKEYQAYDLYIRQYKMSSESQNNIWNLFRLYGYQLNISNVKPLTFMYNNKRRYYNYLKVSNVIFTDSTIAKFSKCKELLDILRREYEEGIVYYHAYKDSFNKYTCDFDKSLENFETSLT